MANEQHEIALKDVAKQATDPQELERQIMNSNVPKNEREWWAAREIERLRGAAAELAAVRAVVPGSLLYECDLVEAVRSTFAEYVKVAAEATALRDIEARKDAAYEERNRVVAALARLFPSGIAKTDIPGWSEDWHGCVYIDLPTGQVSWHYHDSHAHLFQGLPEYTKPWDGHDTEEKYRRLALMPFTPSVA